jgi:hypothetical protein
MASSVIDAIQQDPVALSLATAIKVANETAVREGLDVAAALITVTEETAPPDRSWRVHYGPRDYVRRRGGDLTVLVDEQSASVQQVLRGQ